MAKRKTKEVLGPTLQEVWEQLDEFEQMDYLDRARDVVCGNPNEFALLNAAMSKAHSEYVLGEKHERS